MANESPNSAHFSQFNAANGVDEPPLRVVLMGASNLALMFPTVVETARRAWSRPIEFHAAMGFGRSYGQESGFAGKKFSGILESGIWGVLNRDRDVETIAVVADVGNDLGYETPPAKLLEWVEAALDRLVALGARCAVNNIPLAPLARVGGLRYRVLRTAFFPRCTLSRDELLRRAQEVSEQLAAAAQLRKTPAFAGEMRWYGFDPIHPRRRFAGEIWRRLLGALHADGQPLPLARPAWRTALRMRAARVPSASKSDPISLRLDPSSSIRHGATIHLY